MKDAKKVQQKKQDTQSQIQQLTENDLNQVSGGTPTKRVKPDLRAAVDSWINRQTKN